MKIERLLCNNETRCIHVDTPPRFAWRIAGKQAQLFYRLRILDSTLCVYDSGEVQSKSKTHTAEFPMQACRE